MRKTVLITGLFFAGFILFVNKPTVNAQEATNQNQNQQTEQEPQPVIVEVQKGDSLSKIANSHQTTYSRVFDANTQIKDPNIIYPGDKLRIPDTNEQLTSRLQSVSTVTLPKPEPVKVAPIKPKAKPTPKKATSRPPQVAQKPIQQSTVQSASASVWDDLARCESGGNWAINTGNGYYGGLQFTASTWKAVGGSGLPHQNTREEQIYRAQILQTRSGWGQWPACTKKLGLR